MTGVLRTIGIAVLITATIHATAGICLCHRGPDAPASMPGSHSCCHGPVPTGQVAIGGVPTCCHIESAQRDMTPTDAAQLAPPSTMAVSTVTMPGGRVATVSDTPAFAPSPPVQVLRL
jgi:hypothetical protein